MLVVDGKAVKSPSVFSWGLQDVSSAETGRTQDALMHKDVVAQKRKIDLAWNNPTPAETTTILQAFNKTYVDVTYYDPLIGGNTTKTFYMGDRSAPVKIWTSKRKRYETVSFNIIER